MKGCYLLALLLCGCMGAQKNGLSTSRVQTSMECAAHATQSAIKRAAAANDSLRVAKAKSRELLTVATPSERPLALQVESALEETRTELDGVQEQMKTADEALANSSEQLENLQTQLCARDAELRKAHGEASRLQAGRDFWRACAWKLGLLALAFGMWTFRRPLLALCGGPVL